MNIERIVGDHRAQQIVQDAFPRNGLTMNDRIKLGNLIEKNYINEGLTGKERELFDNLLYEANK